MQLSAPGSRSVPRELARVATREPVSPAFSLTLLDKVLWRWFSLGVLHGPIPGLPLIYFPILWPYLYGTSDFFATDMRSEASGK